MQGGVGTTRASAQGLIRSDRTSTLGLLNLRLRNTFLVVGE